MNLPAGRQVMNDVAGIYGVLSCRSCQSCKSCKSSGLLVFCAGKLEFSIFLLQSIKGRIRCEPVLQGFNIDFLYPAFYVDCH